MKKVTVHFISDPSHGWAKVKKSFLEKLGIANKISPYSYMRGDYVFLEEDADATLLLTVAKESGYEIVIKEQEPAEGQSRIRSYEQYEFMTSVDKRERAALIFKLLAHQTWNASAKRKIKNASLKDLRYWVHEAYKIK